MRVMVTGNLGYLGPAVVDHLIRAGHDVVGLDAGFFIADQLEPNLQVPTTRVDVRDVKARHLDSIDAIVHLANLSNDPMGYLDPALTYAINVEATVRLARMAKEAGVRCFLNSSSCSAYGSATEDWVDEQTRPAPITPYAESKIRAEAELAKLADAGFCVVSYRNATAFGYTRNFRSDLVVNDLTAGALLRGKLQLNSDGSAWRPLVHADDIAQAFALGLEADSARVNGEVINIGDDRQNYRVNEIAESVLRALPEATLTYADGAAPDRRSYRVRFDKVRRLLPAFVCRYDLDSGIADMVANLRRIGLSDPRHGVRLARLEALRESGDVDASLRLRQADGEYRAAQVH